MSARKIRSLLGTEKHLTALMGRVEYLLELQRLWEKLAPPPLARASRVATLDERVLVLFANNGAIAAKIRQFVPTLVEKLQKRGLEVTAIRVRVQVCASPSVPRPKIARLGSGGRASLRHLAEGLEDSPLKTAIERMLKRQAEQDDTAHRDHRQEEE